MHATIDARKNTPLELATDDLCQTIAELPHSAASVRVAEAMAVLLMHQEGYVSLARELLAWSKKTGEALGGFQEGGEAKDLHRRADAYL